MPINIQGAREHNLKNISVEIGDGLTVVTGISGSGKSSLVFDTIFHEAHRRFIEIFNLGAARLHSTPAQVDSIIGLGPAIAIGQNLLNRNPKSNLASASGLHPFLRLLYARFGERCCAQCGRVITILSPDALVEHLVESAQQTRTEVHVRLVHRSPGSHRTLLRLLAESLPNPEMIRVDGKTWQGQPILSNATHDIEIIISQLDPDSSISEARNAVEQAVALGAQSLILHQGEKITAFTYVPACPECGYWFKALEPVLFHSACPHCHGEGCSVCVGTGLHPEAAATTWHGLRFPSLLASSVDEATGLFSAADLPSAATRLKMEILSRLIALQTVGLGYVTLDRPSPSVSRGEAQRVRLAIALTSRLEDMLHILDEPTIGQHPADVERLLSAFQKLPGPVIYVEHDRSAAAVADQAIDLGPGAGSLGGKLLFNGKPQALWQADTPTGRYFSLRQRVSALAARPKPETFLTIHKACLRNLQDIDVAIPLNRLTVITGVSGSGKSTLVEDVLLASIKAGYPIGCSAIEGAKVRPVVVDQSPIGINPRSNPATYTKLADLVRDFFATHTGLSPSHFSFNRPEGACPECKGMGASEVQLRFLPSLWVKCEECEGRRFSEEVLQAKADFNRCSLSIADFYELPISDAAELLLAPGCLNEQKRGAAGSILEALRDIGLGYLSLGQPSPTLSGGEAQRVKLTRYLGRRSLSDEFLILDEPSTGLHPQDVAGLLLILDRLVRRGATIVIVEHNTEIIRAADWIVDLGPGSGPTGGQLIYTGPVDGLTKIQHSLTGQALLTDEKLQPSTPKDQNQSRRRSSAVSIRGARAHNLQNVDVDFPKGAITVVTGVSGSGKSSLVSDVLETEARRRFLESLSMYERQSTHEGPEAPVASVSGLGVAITTSNERRLYERRASVGTSTEISNHVEVLLAELGEKDCPACGLPLIRSGTWVCQQCGFTEILPVPRMFLSRTYAAACLHCHGLGTVQIPEPSRLIIHPMKPLLGGAMYSPGFFPQGYLGKPFNGGHYEVLALAERYQFDPFNLPWIEMTSEAQQAFLFGDPKPMTATFHSRNGTVYSREIRFPGFYGWVRDWDIGGTYTRSEACDQCQGSGLRPQYAAVRLGKHNCHQLSEVSLEELLAELALLEPGAALSKSPFAAHSLQTCIQRLNFLAQVGLGYLNLSRPAGSLSAGEAQRIRLAALLGSGLTSLTILLDEPTRGLHPRETDALIQALYELRDSGNTVILVEHDPQVMRAADNLIDMGPGAGWQGGRIVAQGSPAQVAQADTLTGRWLRREEIAQEKREARPRRTGKGCMIIQGARENNLKNIRVEFPLHALVGVCGVSGSGKSTLMIDTLGRVLDPKKQTTSVAYEPIHPGKHDAILGAPDRVILVDQARHGIGSPSACLNLTDAIIAHFAESADAQLLGLTADKLRQHCSVCGGHGLLRVDLGFLPDVYTPCDTCHGSGLQAEAWEVHLGGIALPDVFALTIDQAAGFFQDEPFLLTPLTTARQVGLGYLVLRQPEHALSGGEAQRLKIARELCRHSPSDTLYMLDEPTIGQHLEDVARLAGVLHHLVEVGNSVIVIEHHPYLLAACDWLLELGPSGGPQGGYLIAAGTPEQIACSDTPSAPFLREVLEGKI
jgi:excinuclease ABC subunit A